MTINMIPNQYPVKFFFLKTEQVPSLEERGFDINCESIDFLKTDMEASEIIAMAKSKVGLKSNVTVICRHNKGPLVKLKQDGSNIYEFVNAVICQCIHLEMKLKELNEMRKLSYSNETIPAYVFVEEARESD